MKKIIAALILISGTAFADGAPIVVDAFLDSKPNSSERWRTILLAECIGGLNQELNGMLYAKRKLNKVPKFSELWCIKKQSRAVEVK